MGTTFLGDYIGGLRPALTARKDQTQDQRAACRIDNCRKIVITLIDRSRSSFICGEIGMLLEALQVQCVAEGFHTVGSFQVRSVLFRRKTSERCGSKRFQLLVLQFGDFGGQF